MPSAQPLPTISDVRTAARQALVGNRDRFGDARTGSMYDHLAGPVSILLCREADNDRDNFRAIYLDDATGEDLTYRVEQLWGIERVLDTPGTGICAVARPSQAPGSGTLFQGTRIKYSGTTAAQYLVAQDTVVGGTAAIVPIRSVATGAGTTATLTGGLTFDDAVYDSTWKPTLLQCGEGTSFEDAGAYLARARAQRLADRTGYLDAMVTTCKAQGAAYVVGFQSNYGLAANDFDGDFGLNAIYVADANFQSPTALISACNVALEDTRVLGADLWIGGIAQHALTVQATVTLRDSPAVLDLPNVRTLTVQALLAYFSATASGYIYKRTQMAGAMVKAHDDVQTVTFAQPAADVTLSPTNWPSTLTRYTLSPRDIQLSFVGAP